MLPRNRQRLELSRRIDLFVLLVGGVLFCPSCFQPPESPSRPAIGQTERVQRIRLLDARGEPTSSLRLKRRTARLSDAIGIPLGQARSIQQSVLVTDRQAQVVWRFRPDSESAQASSDHTSVWIENGEGQPVGWLEFDRDGRIILYGADGARRAAVSRARLPGESEVVVTGADDGQIRYRVRSSDTRGWNVVDAQDELTAQWVGVGLEPWMVAAAYLPSVGAEGEAADALFKLGVFFWEVRCHRVEGCFPR